jgi:hypothetical protein
VVIDGNGLQLIHFKPYCEFFEIFFFFLRYDDVPSIFFKGTHIVPSGGDPDLHHRTYIISGTRDVHSILLIDVIASVVGEISLLFTGG